MLVLNIVICAAMLTSLVRKQDESLSKDMLKVAMCSTEAFHLARSKERGKTVSMTTANMNCYFVEI